MQRAQRIESVRDGPLIVLGGFNQPRSDGSETACARVRGGAGQCECFVDQRRAAGDGVECEHGAARLGGDIDWMSAGCGEAQTRDAAAIEGGERLCRSEFRSSRRCDPTGHTLAFAQFRKRHPVHDCTGREPHCEQQTEGDAEPAV